MAEYFADARKILADANAAGRATAFAQEIGFTLIQCARFEDALRQYKVAVIDRKPEMSEADLIAALAQSRSKDTFGQMLAGMKKAANIETKSLDLLERFKNERNWFIHHMAIEDGDAAYNAGRFSKAVDRMRDLSKMALHLAIEFAKLAEIEAKRLGYTDQELYDASIDRLRDSLK